MSALHALLVGVDRCVPERFPDGLPIPPLAGAVNDVRRMRRFLEEGPPALPPERVRVLVSPLREPAAPAPPADDLPTRDALVREIRALGGRAAPGDRVLVHYSGHGARLPTALPEHKGPTARDECLVPRDAGAPDGGSARLVRDVELHALLHELAARGLRVALILDCCHAGGVTRTHRRTHVRGLGSLPYPPPAASPLGAWQGLAELLPGPPGRPRRDLTPEPGWFPPPAGCVTLAACLSTELAREHLVTGRGYHGALTHALLETLADPAPPGSYRDLHRRVLAAVRSFASAQTPVLLGVEGTEGPDPPAAHRSDRAPSPRAGPSLADRLATELFALERLDDWNRPERRLPVDTASVPVGTLLCLLVRNTASRDVALTVLDHRPDGSVVRIHPYPGDGAFSILDPGAQEAVFLRAELPAGRVEGVDRLELRAADRASLTAPDGWASRWLELVVTRG